MTTEQKAKRYDEAIERVVNIRTGKCETTFIFTEGLFNYLFPELEECNGEEVRKAMIDFFKHEREEGVTVLHYGVNIERMIAWLEKQGQVNETIISQHENKTCKENNDSLTSEDERIRKDIKQHFLYLDDSFPDKAKWLTWLEKQGNPTDINPSEFDLRLNRLLKQFETLPKEELASSLSFYLNVVQNDGTYREEKQDEQKPQGKSALEAIKEEKVDNANKVEPKFKVGDVVCDKSCTQPNLEIVDIRNGLYICDKGYIPISYQDEYVLVAKKIENEIEILFGAKDSELQEATYFIPQGFHAEIDDDKVVIKKGEKSTAWSEEDELKRSTLIHVVKKLQGSAIFEGLLPEELIAWLKSLKQRIKL